MIDEIQQLKQAIDSDDVQRVKSLMTRNPKLHEAPLGYANNGPLTWVAECRVPWQPPGAERLAIARWMIENGSDVHQGGDGPLMRAALNGDRVPMMELLVCYGANVNAHWNGNFPILFAPCEAVDSVALRWLLDHGADPNPYKQNGPLTALDYLIGTYTRSPDLGVCIELLLEAGGETRYKLQGVLDILRRRQSSLLEQLHADPELVNRQFAELDFGSTGGRGLTLKGATLLHLAAEYGNLQAAQLLLEYGADVNARASITQAGVGGQTPLFHAVTQFGDSGLVMAKFLIERGADLAIRAKLPGHYERTDEIVEATALGYALRFPGIPGKTAALLRERGAVE